MDIASTIKFRDICKMFERVRMAKTMQEKEVLLRRYYESFCHHREKFRRNINVTTDKAEDGNTSFFSVLRLLLPDADKTRMHYGLQITTLGRLYANVLQLANDSDGADRLKFRNWTSFHDYAEVVHAVLLPRCLNEPSNLTLLQVHEILDNICNNDTTVKERELKRFSELASAEEQKWLIRILLKSMGLGIGEQRLFDLLHPNAKYVYQRCTNLSRVCNLLADNNLSLLSEAITSTCSSKSNTVIQPFQQIRPMLCERFPGKINELMKSDVLYLETKMDGERFQLHYTNNKFKYISRNGTDYTESFGRTYDHGILTRQLQGLLPLSLRSVILDGEMMVWDTEQRRYREKSENTDVKHLKPECNWRPCFVVYDLLYFNGESLLNMAYVQRVYKLKKLLKEKEGVMHIMKGYKISSLDHFNVLFQRMLDSNCEGIVLKKQNSIYSPGVRVGGGWYKDKADYIDGLITEFDVLIIGGFYNRKRSFVESFLLGVLKPAGESGRDEVYSIGCVPNNTRQRHVIDNELRSHWHNVSTEPPPLWYHYKPSVKDGCPDVWVQPNQSLILQVRAADLTSNSAFFTTKSLHFPRTQLMRPDKVWTECMTLQEFTELCQGRDSIKKLNKRQVHLNDFTAERKRLKLTTAERNRRGLNTYEKRIDSRQQENKVLIFKDFGFCILSGNHEHSKQQLQLLVAQNGGTIIQNPVPNNPQCICIAGELIYLVKRLMEQKPRTIDIVRLDWLVRVCGTKRIDLRPKDVLSATDALRAQFDKSFDEVGDSFIEMLGSIDELRGIMEDISAAQLGFTYIKENTMNSLHQKLLGQTTFHIFRKHFGYFYNRHVDELARLLFMQHGGKLVTNLDESNLTYVFVCPNYLEKQDFEKLHSQYTSRNFKIVSTDWIRQSHRARSSLPTAGFLLKYCED